MFLPQCLLFVNRNQLEALHQYASVHIRNRFANVVVSARAPWILNGQRSNLVECVHLEGCVDEETLTKIDLLWFIDIFFVALLLDPVYRLEFCRTDVWTFCRIFRWQAYFHFCFTLVLNYRHFPSWLCFLCQGSSSCLRTGCKSLGDKITSTLQPAISWCLQRFVDCRLVFNASCSTIIDGNTKWPCWRLKKTSG